MVGCVGVLYVGKWWCVWCRYGGEYIICFRIIYNVCFGNYSCNVIVFIDFNGFCGLVVVSVGDGNCVCVCI